MDYVMTEEEQEIEKEKARVFLTYWANVFSQPQMGKADPKFERSRTEFLESIKPKTKEAQEGPAKVYQWDEELMKRLAASQKGG